MVARIEELDKEDEHPRIKNGPFFECRPGKIIMDNHDDEEDFNKLLKCAMPP